MDSPDAGLQPELFDSFVSDGQVGAGVVVGHDGKFEGNRGVQRETEVLTGSVYFGAESQMAPYSLCSALLWSWN